jgi:hypothetical protein
MGETLRRIDRSQDENIYQPKIHSDRIHQLYEIGQQYNLPMTVILDQAILMYIQQLAQENDEGNLNQ